MNKYIKFILKSIRYYNYCDFMRNDTFLPWNQDSKNKDIINYFSHFSIVVCSKIHTNIRLNLWFVSLLMRWFTPNVTSSDKNLIFFKWNHSCCLNIENRIILSWYNWFSSALVFIKLKSKYFQQRKMSEFSNYVIMRY